MTLNQCRSQTLHLVSGSVCRAIHQSIEREWQWASSQIGEREEGKACAEYDFKEL